MQNATSAFCHLRDGVSCEAEHHHVVGQSSYASTFLRVLSILSRLRAYRSYSTLPFAICLFTFSRYLSTCTIHSLLNRPPDHHCYLSLSQPRRHSAYIFTLGLAPPTTNTLQPRTINMKTYTATTFFSLLALATAQSSTTANASQSSAVSSALESYRSSLEHGPVATSIAVAVGLGGGIPASLLPSVVSDVPSIVPTPTDGGNLYSFATAPPVTFTEPAWVTQYLPASLQSEVMSLQTSVVEAEASIIRDVLSITATPASASASSSGTASASSASSSVAAHTNAGAAVQPAGVAMAAMGAVALGAIALL